MKKKINRGIKRALAITMAASMAMSALSFSAMADEASATTEESDPYIYYYNGYDINVSPHFIGKTGEWTMIFRLDTELLDPKDNEENLKKEGVDVLVVIGGDGTLTSARDFARKGVKVIGVPKTIDNDLASTDVTFGFNTAIDVVTEALDRLHTTAESHHRIMLCEVMGRNAGWIALEAGIAGSADIILLPEIPYDINKIAEKVKEREEEGKNFTIIVVSEGAKPKDGEVVVAKIVADSPDPIRLGGIGNKLAGDLEKLIKDHEVRCTVLGHVQRGGNTSTYDRILSTRYGVAAVELMMSGKFGEMVCLKGDTISSDTLENVIGQRTKNVNIDGELVRVAKKIGITFAE